MNGLTTLPVSHALASTASRVKVIGVGDAGGRAASGMADSLRGLADVLCVDTDSAALQRINNARRLLIGQDTLSGFGSGGDAEAAGAAARDAEDEIRSAVGAADIVVILAGLGGGAGSGAAPVIAAIARECGAQTFCVVNTPFEFEGPGRQSVAAKARGQLCMAADAVADMSNDRMVSRAAQGATLEQALAKGSLLAGGIVRTLAALFGPHAAQQQQQVAPGDVRSVLSGGTAVLMGEGEASGQAAAAQAAEAALSSSFSNHAAIERAGRAIVLIESGPELSISQVAAAMGTVRAKAGDAAALHMGISHSRRMAGRVRVTVVAACSEPKRRAGIVRSERTRAAAAPADRRVLLPLLA